MASALGFLKSQDHALAARSNYDADVAFLARFDLFAGVFMDIEVQTVERGKRGPPDLFGRRGKEPFLGAFLAARFKFRVIAAGEGSGFRFLGLGDAGRGRRWSGLNRGWG